MLETLAPFAGLLGLIGLVGLAGIKHPVAKDRAGAAVRLLGILGLAGFAGIWIEGAGAIGAAGALGLWNHQDPKLARWGRFGWVFPVGIPFLAAHFLG